MYKSMENNGPISNQQVKHKKWPQYLAAILATQGALCAGCVLGWTSPALPYLQGNSTEALTKEEASWVGAIAPLGALVGALPAGFLADAIGRRTLLLLLASPYFFSWVLIILAHNSVCLLCIARFLAGLAVGATTVVTPLYNEEISEDRIRGALGVYMDLMLCVGILWVYAIGAFVPYFWLSIASCALPVVFCLTFFWMPESPVYLLSKGKSAKAEKSLRWLRGVKIGSEHEVQVELNRLQNRLDDKTKKSSTTNEKRPFLLIVKKFLLNLSFSSPTAKAMKIVFGLMLFQQLTGIDAVLFYTVDIFDGGGSTMSPFLSTILVGVVQVVATYVSSLLVDHTGRRVLLLISEAAMAVCLGTLVAFFYLYDSKVDVTSYGWVPLASLTTFTLMFAIGFGPIPWFMMAELVPVETKGWVSAIAVCLNWSMVFAVTKVFSGMVDQFGRAGTFGIFTANCVVGVIFVAVLVPETKGKSLEQIQAELCGTNVPKHQQHFVEDGNSNKTCTRNT